MPHRTGVRYIVVAFVIVLGSTRTRAVDAPLTAAYPHDRKKNRYISFDPNKPANDGINVAFRVELLSINMGSCDDGTGALGGNVDFCREDRGADDCNACSISGDSCISAETDCLGGESCDPTGATCVNDLPNSGGSNVGLNMWVGPENVPGSNTHLLVSEAFRKVSSDWPNPTHVADCEIVPQASYGVSAVETAGGAESGQLVVETTQLPVSPPVFFWWGDVVGALIFHCNGDIRETTCSSPGDCGGDPCERAWELPDGVVNFGDVTAVQWTAFPSPPATVSADVTWVDVHGNQSFTPGSAAFDPPNYIVNASDLSLIFSAFEGRPYPHYDPADCPGAVVETGEPCCVGGTCSLQTPADCVSAGGKTVCECLGDSEPNGSDDACECTVLSSAPLADPGAVPRNRYVSFQPNHGTDCVAYRVELTSSDDFPACEGLKKWVSPPHPTTGIARLQDDPEYRDWSGDPSVIHVGDLEIVPVASYEIRAIFSGCDTGSELNFSPGLSVSTIARPTLSEWGDVAGSLQKFCGGDFTTPNCASDADCTPPETCDITYTPPNGLTNFDDVAATVQGYLFGATAPPLTWVDLGPAIPNQRVEGRDLSAVVRAFGGNAYAPSPCGSSLRADQTSAHGTQPLVDPPAVLECELDPNQILLPGDSVSVRLFVDQNQGQTVPNVEDYQSALGVGRVQGTSGSLDCTSAQVETARSDYLFISGGSIINIGDCNTLKAFAMAGTGAGAAIPPRSYMSTFNLTASADSADSTYEIAILDEIPPEQRDQIQTREESFLEDITVPLPNRVEFATPNSPCTVRVSADCNGNGKPDDCEVDDGSPGGVCDQGLCDPADCSLVPDCNENGVPDACDLPPLGSSNDCDADGVPDECQLVGNDCNGNGIPDVPVLCEPDTDSDTIIDDCDNCPNDANTNQADCNNDGEGDLCDPQADERDNDSDGVCNGVDNCPDDSNPRNQILTDCNGDTDTTDPGEAIGEQCDQDQDGVGDACDNCLTVSNAGQENCNGDAEGDLCEADPAEQDNDGDGLCNAGDNCPDDSNPGQEDTDLDGADGVGDACDNCPDHANPPQNDCDDDGMGDVCAVAPGGPSLDCNDNGNGNGIPDECEIVRGKMVDCPPPSGPPECFAGPFFCDEPGCDPDCNDNGIPDTCDIDSGISDDCGTDPGNEVPDECEPDCDGNTVADSCDIERCAPGDPDCKDCQPEGLPGHGVPDWCDINVSMISTDSDGNGVPDECDFGPALPAPYPHNRKKTRYITFDANKTANDGKNVAFRVELADLDLGSCEGNGAPCRVVNLGGDCGVCCPTAGGPCTDNPCILTAIDCNPGQTCELTGQLCLDDHTLDDDPVVGQQSIGRSWWVGAPVASSCTVTGVPCTVGGAPCGRCRDTASGQLTGRGCTQTGDCDAGDVCEPQDLERCDSIHRLVEEAQRHVSPDWPSVIQVGDCEVVPVARYDVVAVDVDSGLEASALPVETIDRPATSAAYWADALGQLDDLCTGTWTPCGHNYGPCVDGDCVRDDPQNPVPDTAFCDGVDCIDPTCPAGESCIQQWAPPDGLVTFVDIQAAVFSWAQAPGRTLPAIAWVDVHGETPAPNYLTNSADIQFMVLAFEGRPYPFSDPGDCP